MNDHPNRAELKLFFYSCGELPADRARQIVRHLLRGCESCRAEAEPLLRVMFGNKRVAELSPSEEASYDSAIGRVVPFTRKKEDDVSICEDLLERSWAFRYQDPSRMVELAQLAVSTADRLSDDLYGVRRVRDLQCRARTELANAHRVADDLDQAESELTRAAELYLDGSEDELLKARVYDVQASLSADRRHFEIALEAIDKVYEIHTKRGDEHMAGRALVSKGIYTGYKGEAEEAIRLLAEGLSRIDDRREPGLSFRGVYNQLCFLVDCGRHAEAQEVLSRSRQRRDLSADGRVSRIKLLWLQGRIHAGLERLDEAEREFLAAKQGFEEAGLGYNAALSSLDLADVCLRQGNAAEAERSALEAIYVFYALRVHREALAAGLLLLERVREEVRYGCPTR
jgi:tetratricopeptide (TPR) repeat protein